MGHGYCQSAQIFRDFVLTYFLFLFQVEEIDLDERDPKVNSFFHDDTDSSRGNGGTGSMNKSPKFDNTTEISKRNPPVFGPQPYTPVGNVITDDDVGPEMKFISQIEGTALNDMLTFSFKDYAGTGITVYVHDSGINLGDPEFTDIIPYITRGRYRWLYPKATEITGLMGQDIPRPTTDENPDLHGTCVVSKIVGIRWGVAKAANVRIIPWIDLTRISYVLAGMQAIVDDIYKQRKKGDYFPVVNLSYTLGNMLTSVQSRSYKKFLQVLVDFDAVIVAAAGNLVRGETNLEVDEPPALFVPDFPRNMIAVGATDVRGVPLAYSKRGRLVGIWAPGALNATHGVECAGGRKADVPKGRIGTSVAAPQISGIVAYLYSVYPGLRTAGSAAPKVLAKLRSLRFPRFAGGPLCVWNGVMGEVRCN